MALELFIGKYIDDLVPANPVGGTDPKSQGDDHIGGIKLVLQNTFPALSGIMNCSEVELNYLYDVTPGNNAASKAPVLDSSKDLVLGTGDVRCTDVIPSGSLYQGGSQITASATELNQLDGDVGVLNQTDDIVLFYMSAAPTGWTQEQALANLDGSTIRIETGLGGGAVAGTHNIESPPSISHSHADTLYTSNKTLSANDIPTLGVTVTTERFGSNDDQKSTTDIAAGTTNSADGTSSVTGKASWVNGTPQSHNHTVYGSVSTATLTAFAPKYVNMILCKKD